MSDAVLFVFEGAKTEKHILESLKKCFFSSERSPLIVTSYDADIYQLWNEVAKDPYLDLIEVIRERNPSSVEGIARDDVSQTFLFFDYDGHATKASDDSIDGMLTHFSNDSNTGMLFISYPMVEALRHLNSDADFNNMTFEISRGTEYKKVVDSESDFRHVKKYTEQDWKYIASQNLKKANFLINNTSEPPAVENLGELGQKELFDAQLSRFITPSKHVAVLSAFPFFLVQYFANKEQFLICDT